MENVKKRKGHEKSANKGQGMIRGRLRCRKNRNLRTEWNGEKSKTKQEQPRDKYGNENDVDCEELPED